MILAVLLSIVGATNSQRVLKIPSGATTYRLMHVSDVHYHPFGKTCYDIPPEHLNGQPCNATNTTRFLRSVIETDKPQLVVHTGDIIDGGSEDPVLAMDTLYGVSEAANLPWAASLGNHDEESTLSREQVMEHILGMSKEQSEMGPVDDSFGNFYVDLVSQDGDDVVARLVFFDSRIDHVHVMINDAQLSWFKNLTKSLPPAPTLAFYHIPFTEYSTALHANHTISGGYHEPVSANGPNPNIFPVLQEAGVLAGFCGHDHTNDYCVEWQGVQLCYEGSPGYTAYGNDGSKGYYYERRARVTELQLSNGKLSALRSFKRVSDGTALAGPKVDDEVLWSASGLDQNTQRRYLSKEERDTVAASSPKQTKC